jgi:hypothetical protein
MTALKMKQPGSQRREQNNKNNHHHDYEWIGSHQTSIAIDY